MKSKIKLNAFYTNLGTGSVDSGAGWLADYEDRDDAAQWMTWEDWCGNDLVELSAKEAEAAGCFERVELNEIADAQREAVREAVRNTIAKLRAPSVPARGLAVVQDLVEDAGIEVWGHWRWRPCLLTKINKPFRAHIRASLSAPLLKDLRCALKESVGHFIEYDIYYAFESRVCNAQRIPRSVESFVFDCEDQSYCSVRYLQELVYFKAAAALGVVLDSEKLRLLEEFCIHGSLAIVRDRRLAVLGRGGVNPIITDTTDDAWHLPIYCLA